MYPEEYKVGYNCGTTGGACEYGCTVTYGGGNAGKACIQASVDAYAAAFRTSHENPQ